MRAVHVSEVRAWFLQWFLLGSCCRLNILSDEYCFESGIARPRAHAEHLLMCSHANWCRRKLNEMRERLRESVLLKQYNDFGTDLR